MWNKIWENKEPTGWIVFKKAWEKSNEEEREELMRSIHWRETLPLMVGMKYKNPPSEQKIEPLEEVVQRLPEEDQKAWKKWFIKEDEIEYYGETIIETVESTWLNTMVANGTEEMMSLLWKVYPDYEWGEINHNSTREKQEESESMNWLKGLVKRGSLKWLKTVEESFKRERKDIEFNNEKKARMVIQYQIIPQEGWKAWLDYLIESRLTELEEMMVFDDPKDKKKKMKIFKEFWIEKLFQWGLEGKNAHFLIALCEKKEWKGQWNRSELMLNFGDRDNDWKLKKFMQVNSVELLRKWMEVTSLAEWSKAKKEPSWGHWTQEEFQWYRQLFWIKEGDLHKKWNDKNDSEVSEWLHWIRSMHEQSKKTEYKNQKEWKNIYDSIIKTALFKTVPQKEEDDPLKELRQEWEALKSWTGKELIQLVWVNSDYALSLWHQTPVDKKESMIKEMAEEIESTLSRHNSFKSMSPLVEWQWMLEKDAEKINPDLKDQISFKEWRVGDSKEKREVMRLVEAKKLMELVQPDSGVSKKPAYRL